MQRLFSSDKNLYVARDQGLWCFTKSSSNTLISIPTRGETSDVFQNVPWREAAFFPNAYTLDDVQVQALHHRRYRRWKTMIPMLKEKLAWLPALDIPLKWIAHPTGVQVFVPAVKDTALQDRQLFGTASPLEWPVVHRLQEPFEDLTNDRLHIILDQLTSPWPEQMLSALLHEHFASYAMGNIRIQLPMLMSHTPVPPDLIRLWNWPCWHQGRFCTRSSFLIGPKPSHHERLNLELRRPSWF